MSATSIKDEGFTPPDFIQKLFKRTSTACSQHNFTSDPSSNHLNFTYSHFTSLSSIPIAQPKYSPSRLHRANSLNQQQRISTKKFKIFYNTILEDVYPEIQSLQIWQRFEKSLNNPFQYDRFIEDLRQFKEKQRQQSNISQTVLSQLNLQHLPKKSPSLEKFKQKQAKVERIFLSTHKRNINSQNQKQKAINSIKYVRNIIRHGQRYIKQR